MTLILMSPFCLRNLELHKEEMDEVTRQKDKEISHMKLQHEMNEKVNMINEHP